MKADSSAITELGMQEPKPPIAEADITLSNRFVSLHGNNLRYVASFDRWLLYDAERGLWVRDERLYVYTLAKRVCVAAAHDALASIKSKSEARATAKEILSARKVAAIISLARSHPKIAARDDWFDADPWLLNTPDGAIELRTGLSRDARREDYCTKRTAVAPTKMATPIFDLFLLEIMGEHVSPAKCSYAACAASIKKPQDDRIEPHNAEVRALGAYLLRVYGYAHTGIVRDHKLFLQLGEGGNGKGVLNDFISQDIFGTYPIGYACEVPIEALLESKGERHPTELMDLWHTRLAIARESDEDTRWNEGRVKRLTGGDRIKARRMRQDFVEFDPTHKLIVFGNADPTFKSSDQSAWKRRLDMTRFPQKFDDAADEAKGIRQADKDLREKLKAEAPGVLQKLIDACLEWQKGGLQEPATVRESSNSYLSKQSTILSWIEERLNMSAETKLATTTVNALWTDYSQWCGSRKEQPCARRDFNDKLERAGIRITRTGGQRGICSGVALKFTQDETP
jgi:putative DNA primase/helicase